MGLRRPQSLSGAVVAELPAAVAGVMNTSKPKRRFGRAVRITLAWPPPALHAPNSIRLRDWFETARRKRRILTFSTGPGWRNWQTHRT